MDGTFDRWFSTDILPLVETRNQFDVTSDGKRFLVDSSLANEEFRITVVVDWTSELPAEDSD